MDKTKSCSKCGEEFPLSNFNLYKCKPRSYCKACHTSSVVKWQRENKEKYNARKLAWLDKNYPDRPRRKPKMPDEIRATRIREQKAAWRIKNVEKMASARRLWDLNNRHKILEKTRRYQASKRNAVPLWADKETMSEFYRKAKELTISSGIRYEVDHIIPLVSNIVCGLHCEDNLQVLPIMDNRAKSNKLIHV